MANNRSQLDEKKANIASNPNGESQPAVNYTPFSPENPSEGADYSKPARSVSDGERPSHHDPPHVAKKPWIKQTSISESLPLRDHQRETKSLATGLKPADTVKAWLRNSFFLKDWDANTHLCEIIEGVYAESPTESPNIELSVVGSNWRVLRDGKKIRIRWLHLQSTKPDLKLLQSRVVRTTEPVIFLSTPSLALPGNPAKDKRIIGSSPRTLLQFLYGSGFRTDSDRNVGDPALQRPDSDLVNALNVPETGFLMIGSGVNSHKLLYRVLDNLGIFKYQIFVALLKTTQSLESTLAIEKTCDYETFLKKAKFALDIRVGLEKYVLVDEHRILVDKETWTEYMRSGEVERHVFHFDESLRSLWTQTSRQPDGMLQGKQQATVLPLIPGGDIDNSVAETSQELPLSEDPISPSEPLVELTGTNNCHGPEKPPSALSLSSLPGSISEGDFVPFLFWKSPKRNPQVHSDQQITERYHLADRLFFMQFEEPVGELDFVDLCTRETFELKWRIAKVHEVAEPKQINVSVVPVHEFEKPKWLSISPLLNIAHGHDFNFQWKELPPEGCNDCRQGASYKSVSDALRHIYAYHIERQQSVKDDMIIYDRGLGWLQWRVAGPQLDESYTSIVRQLSEDLLDIWTMSHEIHTLALGKNLFLLQSLMDTFEHIIIKLALAAEELAQLKKVRLRIPETRSRRYHPSSRAKYFHISKKHTNHKIWDSLNRAKQSVIMADIDQDGLDRLNISSISPEVLVTIFLNNLHRDTIVRGSRKKLDIVKHYQRISNALRSAAIRNPARKRFLEISRLEEELEALQAVLDVQECTVERYKVAINPVGLKPDPTSPACLQHRKDVYGLEARYLDSQIKRLAEDRETLEMLRTVAKKARKDMRQVLEVLDEGHGKAIRVFTFVTLFFLPLSFVTSFFGMNTTDVRDIQWNQRIFWSSAIPLTLLVLSIALLYGYKWDLIVCRVRSACRSRQEPGLHSIWEVDLEHWKTVSMIGMAAPQPLQ
ncbi:mg2+ transporter [Fusarium flagelliforme]|uniref:Mg2+ transporter n=1 Tax=Fusarium flagelliforme TaxID=2675880 RepID=A0A395MZT1_9HYPO|nr:mg2+ transporter [Fusarium flagelliforme]